MFNSLRFNLRTSARVDTATNACHLGTTSLIEDDVFDAAGHFLGEIEEIVIDVRTGCIRFVVLAMGGFLGIGRKRLAVPWSALTPDPDYRRCIVDVTLMQLMALPVPQDDPWLRRAAPANERAHAPAAVAGILGRNSARTSHDMTREMTA